MPQHAHQTPQDGRTGVIVRGGYFGVSRNGNCTLCAPSRELAAIMDVFQREIQREHCGDGTGTVGF
ncbi:hypothetical protein [Gluconobacter cerinus]|uniref:hypothetical protein n=1 Tax=Gluconobacter cerinus TaxID=38307 RepID=UPI001B8B6B35|nr:hypothetical protein [Gluconobacter cerinus]MBS1038811.1 hypothetical protein [Gluconobacter cerinus]